MARSTGTWFSGLIDNRQKWSRFGAGNTPVPKRFFISAQALKLLETARGSRLKVLLTIALVTGMRQGELRSLRWHDINFDEGIS